MVKGIVGDANISGHIKVLHSMLVAASWREVWASLGYRLYSFEDLGLAADDPDVLVWATCQREEVALVTDNRNEDGPDSLGATIRACNTPTSLPVFTLADATRFLTSKDYAQEVVESLLEYLLDIDAYRGTGRLYLP
jgi:hypothetical protein